MEQLEQRRLLSAAVTVGASTPFLNNVPAALPGVIQAENFDNGGEGVAYYNPNPGNFGGQDRSTDIGIENTSDTAGYDSAGSRVNGSTTPSTLATPGTIPSASAC